MESGPALVGAGSWSPSRAYNALFLVSQLFLSHSCGMHHQAKGAAKTVVTEVGVAIEVEPQIIEVLARPLTQALGPLTQNWRA